jgi:hypothetical protein
MPKEGQLQGWVAARGMVAATVKEGARRTVAATAKVVAKARKVTLRSRGHRLTC